MASEQIEGTMFQLIDIPPKYRMVIIFAVSMIASMLVFRPILNIAKKKNLVDNPEARKLQKEPIPILGGAAVFFGIIMGITFFKTWYNYISIFPVISAMVMMLYIGMMDDISDIKPGIRFALEIVIALLLVFGTRNCISDFQGLWGIDKVNTGVGVALSVLTFVGIVNACNMVDGIDGLSATLSIQICVCFFFIFFLAHDYSYAALTTATMAAIVPFLVHNIYGYSSKMFIGDGGTMVIGTMFSAMIFEVLDGRFSEALATVTESTLETGIFGNLSLIAFSLAVFSLPVSDTLRVMIERISHGLSPFTADNRHLHHLFVTSGFSHIGTVACENLLNLLCIIVSISLWLSGAGMEWQLYGVVVAALVTNLVPATLLRYSTSHPESSLARFVSKCAGQSHVESRDSWVKIQKIIDRD